MHPEDCFAEWRTHPPLFHGCCPPLCSPLMMEMPAGPVPLLQVLPCVCVLLCPWNGFLEVGLPEPRASGFPVQFRGCSWGALLFASLGAARRRLVLTVSSPEVSIELLDYCQSDRWGRVPRCTVTAYFSSCGCVQVTLTCLTLFSFSFVSPVCSCLWLYFTRL